MEIQEIKINSEKYPDKLKNIYDPPQVLYAIGNIEEREETTIPADPNVKNFSYTIIDGKVYFRENSIMAEQDLPITTISRIKGMIELRDCVRELIDLQTEDYPDENIKAAQEKLNRIYDNFVKKSFSF